MTMTSDYFCNKIHSRCDKFEIYQINKNYALISIENKLYLRPLYNVHHIFRSCKTRIEENPMWQRWQLTFYRFVQIHNLYGFGISKSRQLNISNVNGKSRMTHQNLKKHNRVLHTNLFVVCVSFVLHFFVSHRFCIVLYIPSK